MLFGWEQTYDQAWIVNESESLGSRRHMHAYELSYMAGYVGLVGLSLFAAIEEHTIEAYLVRLLPSMEQRSDLQVWMRQSKSEEWNDEVLKKMMSKVIKDTHASGRDSMGHDSQANA